MNEGSCEIGVVGLGVMGRNLVLNIADHGHTVAGLDKDTCKVTAMCESAAGRNIHATDSVAGFVKLLRTPRAALLLVPAGPPVDAVVRELASHFQPGDVIIDGGNSHFHDTDVRAKALAKRGIAYLGVGISGGEHGAHYGPSLMPGGPREAYELVRPIFEQIAARVDVDPCVRYLGPGSAGHYVKMVHNGIEYTMMQLIAESYDVMKRGLGLSDDDLHDVFDEWSQSEFGGYLLGITAIIFCRPDEMTGKRLVDAILDEAKQKGTGKWTLQDALDLQAPTPTIYEAVAARDMSAYKAEREAASRVLGGETHPFGGNPQKLLNWLRNSFHISMMISYAQGFAQLHIASTEHGYGLNLADVATVWRGGCIIRSGLLEGVRAVFQDQPDLPNLLLSKMGKEVSVRQEHLRRLVGAAAEMGIPIPAYMASLAYFDGYRSAWLPANLTQAQRDYFGAHTYERVDAKGVFHTQWERD